MACQPRTCYRCGQSKSIDEFPFSRRSPDGFGFACKPCEADRLMVKKHGVTALEKSRLADAQDGCAICGCPNPGGRGWGVDHDRSCCPGDASCPSCRRGILCHWCNTALGYAGDDVARLRRMADYLELGTRLRTESEPDIRSGLSAPDPTDKTDETDETQRLIPTVNPAPLLDTRARVEQQMVAGCGRSS